MTRFGSRAGCSVPAAISGLVYAGRAAEASASWRDAEQQGDRGVRDSLNFTSLLYGWAAILFRQPVAPLDAFTAVPRFVEPNLADRRTIEATVSVHIPLFQANPTCAK
jgi:hypothetical protein